MTTTALATRPAELMLAGPLGSLDHYIQAASAIPVLSAEEEFELATRLRETNDLDAAKRLVLSHLRFVVHVARGYAGYGLQLGDLIQEGNIGLMKAVRRFDPERRRAPGLVRRSLDSSRNPRIRAAQLALGPRGHDQGSAQAVLQSAQGQKAPRLAQQGRSRGRSSRSRRDDTGRCRDGAALERPRRVVRPRS